MAEVELNNVSKRWGSFVGVDNFNLTIPDKEFLVLLGPSGCGKTTTMRMIDPATKHLKWYMRGTSKSWLAKRLKKYGKIAHTGPYTLI